jgi:hypothetical protein
MLRANIEIPQLNIHISDTVLGQLESFEKAIKIAPSVADAIVHEQLHQLLKLVYFVTYEGLETVRNSNALELFIAFVNYQRDGSFKDPGCITQGLAALAFSIRSVAVTEIIAGREKEASVDDFKWDFNFL